MILRCSCKHKDQDHLHGPGHRVHNPGKASDGGVKWRCTVCEKEQASPKGYVPQT